MKKYLAASVAVFVWLLLWDNFLSGMIIGSTISTLPGINASYSKLWEAVGDLCIALVLTGLYARTRSIFGENAAGGATYGFYAGLVANFPTWLNMVVYFSWPYRSAWILTITFVALSVVSGAIMGSVYKAMGGAKAA